MLPTLTANTARTNTDSLPPSLGSSRSIPTLFRQLILPLCIATAMHAFLAHADESTARHIDWSLGAVQETSASCGAFTFTNLPDHAASSLIVMGKEGGLCTFAHDGLEFHVLSGYGVVTTGKGTIFNFYRTGQNVFLNFVTGY